MYHYSRLQDNEESDFESISFLSPAKHAQSNSPTFQPLKSQPSSTPILNYTQKRCSVRTKIFQTKKNEFIQKKKKVQKEVCIQEYDGFVVTDLVITGSYTSMIKQSGLNDSGQQAPPLCIALHDQPNFHCLWKIQQAPEKFIAVLLPQTYEVAWT